MQKDLKVKRALIFILWWAAFILLVGGMCSCSARYHAKKFIQKGGIIDSIKVEKRINAKIELNQEWLNLKRLELVKIFRDSLPCLDEESATRAAKISEVAIIESFQHIDPIDTVVQVGKTGSVGIEVDSIGNLSVSVDYTERVNVECPECPFINWGYIKWWQWFLIGLFIVLLILGIVKKFIP